MKKLKDKKVGNLVAEDYRYADVFRKYGIDFCCGGGVSVEDICRKKGLDYQQVVNELTRISTDFKPTQDYNNWELDRLIDHIVTVHHQYVRENLPLLGFYATKVAQVHGITHPETVEISRLIDDLQEELTPHLEKEEVVLFPFIKRLLAPENATQIEPAAFGTVENPIKCMISEHEAAGEIMSSIARLSSNFTPPESACNTYRVLYKKLKEFERDLHEHIHLENNILFPKVIAMVNHTTV